MKKLLALLICLVSIFDLAISEDFTVIGRIVDKKTGEGIPGASIRILNTTKGSYSSARGLFRLRLSKQHNKLKISSLGRKSKTLTVAKSSDTLVVPLLTDAARLGTVRKTANIDANNIMKRAIARKNENYNRIKTISSSLQSKLSISLGDDLASSVEGVKSNQSQATISLGLTSKPKAQADAQFYLLETKSDYYYDRENNLTRSVITHRRQTKNINPAMNVVSLSEFKNLYNDRIQIVKTSFTSPLASDAFDVYNFVLKKRSVLDDRYIYVLTVEPISELYPAFQGTIQIVEGTYDVVELDLRPSETSSIEFIKDVRIIEKFEEIEPNKWFPSFMHTTAKMDFKILSMLPKIEMDFDASSVFSESSVNKIFNDSIFAENYPRVSVSSIADSSNSGFWERESLFPPNKFEEDLYVTIDSLASTRKDSLSTDNGNDIYTIMPSLEINRASSVSLGFSSTLDLYATFESNANFSFGLQRFMGELSSSIDLYKSDKTTVSIDGNIFSRVSSITQLDNQSRLLNTVAFLISAKDYYDYYRQDGFSFGANIKNDLFSVGAEFENSQHFALKKTTDNTLFNENILRENPSILDATYRTIKTNIKLGEIDFTTQDFAYEIKLDALYGESKDVKSSFRSISGSAHIKIPLIETGYQPITLDLKAKAGKANKDIPIQYQFRMSGNAFIFGSFDNFYSAPYARFGGHEFFSFHSKLDLSDFLWRAVHLPKMNGRGLTLALTASSGKFFSDIDNHYHSTDGEYYSELGFELGRIPTFISDLFYFKFCAAAGVGNLGTRNFGWSLSFHLPF